MACGCGKKKPRPVAAPKPPASGSPVGPAVWDGDKPADG